MKILVKPIKQFVPGHGVLTANQLNVNVGHYELGGRIRGSYELLAVVPLEGGKPDATKEIQVASGSVELTKKQADAWGADDTHFCRCIAENAGLTPA